MLKREAITPERVELLRSWQQSGFNLNTTRRVAAGDRQSLETLLQYIERPPVSLRRLTYRDDGMVHYQGRFHPGLGRDHQFVTPVEFLAMLVPHIALRYEVKIRTYGALSTTVRKRFGWIQEEEESSTPDVITVDEEDEESEFVRVRKRNWARLIARVWKDDPEIFPECGSKLEVLSAFVARQLASQSSPPGDAWMERLDCWVCLLSSGSGSGVPGGSTV